MSEQACPSIVWGRIVLLTGKKHCCTGDMRTGTTVMPSCTAASGHHGFRSAHHLHLISQLETCRAPEQMPSGRCVHLRFRDHVASYRNISLHSLSEWATYLFSDIGHWNVLGYAIA